MADIWVLEDIGIFRILDFVVCQRCLQVSGRKSAQTNSISEQRLRTCQWANKTKGYGAGWRPTHSELYKSCICLTLLSTGDEPALSIYWSKLWKVTWMLNGIYHLILLFTVSSVEILKLRFIQILVPDIIPASEPFYNAWLKSWLRTSRILFNLFASAP